jgi:hypothetical protein
MQDLGKPPAYRSYLLRLWQERSEQPAMVTWRCSLEDPLSGQRHGFASLDALVSWLKAELAEPRQTGPAETG